MTIVTVVSMIVLHIPSAFGATQVESVEGSAYGVYASVDLILAEGWVGPTPSASIPSTGGSQTRSKATVDLDVASTLFLGTVHVVDTGLLVASSESSGVGGPNGEVESEATVNYVELINSLVTADEVVAECSASASGVSGDVTLVGASVAGVGSISAHPTPNSYVWVKFGGLTIAKLTLNKQTVASDGTLTVTALSLSLLEEFGTGTVNVARAVCGVDTAEVSTTTTTAPTTTTTTPGTTSTTTPGQSTTTTSPDSTTTTAPDTTTTSPDDGTTTTVPDSGPPTTIDSDVAGNGLSRGGDGGDGGDHLCWDDSATRNVAGLKLSGPAGPGTSVLGVSITADPDAGSGGAAWWLLLLFTILGLVSGAAATKVNWSELKFAGADQEEDIG